MKWAKSLKLASNFDIEKRVERILEFISNSDPFANCYLSDLDATGLFGSPITKELNIKGLANYSISDVLKIFKEDGQVFEMQLKMESKIGIFEIIIRDGSSVDILGSNDTLPLSVFEDFEELNVYLFNRDSN